VWTEKIIQFNLLNHQRKGFSDGWKPYLVDQFCFIAEIFEILKGGGSDLLEGVFLKNG
jgi:hypothetical protein